MKISHLLNVCINVCHCCGSTQWETSNYAFCCILYIFLFETLFVNVLTIFNNSFLDPLLFRSIVNPKKTLNIVTIQWWTIWIPIWIYLFRFTPYMEIMMIIVVFIFIIFCLYFQLVKRSFNLLLILNSIDTVSITIQYSYIILASTSNVSTVVHFLFPSNLVVTKQK